MPIRSHGLSKDPIYSVWNQMRQRCVNPAHPMYRWYGGRGLNVCQRWLDSVESFIADMGPRPAGHTLERKDNSLGYSPRNCVWATRSVQARNRAPMGTYLSPTEHAKWKLKLVERLRIQGRRPRPERRVKPRPCLQCGVPYIHHSGHTTQKYCSQKCYGIAQIRPLKTCICCGTQFKPKGQAKIALYCGKPCFFLHRTEKARSRSDHPDN